MGGDDMQQQRGFSLEIRPYPLDAALEPYFSALYSFSITCSDGKWLEDCLHPEWAAMRFTDENVTVRAGIYPEDQRDIGAFVGSGPTNRAFCFSVPTVRFTSLGLRAAGWARFVPFPASDLANRIVDGSHPAFAAFVPLIEEMRGAGGDHAVAAARMNAYLSDLHERTPPAPPRVLACQAALRDPELHEVDDLADRVDVGRRTLERLCSRYFGFPPKLLLRRQRFLRSLGRFLLDPAGGWSEALDGQYCDQAHFVHDFRSFMGMTPSQYAAMEHPILNRIAAQRLFNPVPHEQPDLPTIMRLSVYPSAGDAAESRQGAN